MHGGFGYTVFTCTRAFHRASTIRNRSLLTRQPNFHAFKVHLRGYRTMTVPQSRETLSEHKESVRVLVLETDDPHPEDQEERGSFGDILDRLFQEAGEKHDPKLGVETQKQYVVEDKGGKVPRIEEIGKDIHAILLTGSQYNAHGDTPWILKLTDLVKQTWLRRPDIRWTGICFGHQILCRTLGSEVRPHPDGLWEISHTPIDLTHVGRKLFALPDDTSRVHLHQMHLDHVVNPPSRETTDLLGTDTEVHVWGSSDQTGVQGIYIPRRLLSSQGHMEFDEKMVRRQLDLRVESGSLEEQAAEEAKESADWMHDGLQVAQTALRFFHGDDDNVH